MKSVVALRLFRAYFWLLTRILAIPTPAWFNQYQSSDVPNTTAHTYASANIPKKQVTKNLIDSFALVALD